jgi:hypothetical protein
MMSRATQDGSSESRHRVRLVSVDSAMEPHGLRRVRVTLEWAGEQHEGEQVGEAAAPLALRTAANAALVALRKVAPDAPDVRLVGVKQIRAFDADVLVVALSSAVPPRQLVGAVLVNDSPLRAAATAVLHALNRVLGNYISVR